MNHDRKIKVCVVLSDMNIGGAGRAMSNIISAFDRERFAFSVILPCGSHARGLFRGTGAEVIHLPIRGDISFDAAAIPYYIRTFKKLSPDIVHTNASLSARIAARAAGVTAIVMTKHTSDTPRLPAALCAGGALCTRAIAVGMGAAKALLAYGIPREKINIIANGAPDMPPPTNLTRKRAAAQLGFSPNDKIIGNFARLEPCKTQEVFIRAAAICLKKDPTLRFFIAGDGSRRSELEARAESLGLADNFVFCGALGDPTPYMSLCTATVSTTAGGEAASMAAIEAMCLGIPQIMTDTPDNKHMVGSCGILTEPRSAVSTAEAIMRLCSDTELHDRLAQNARKIYLERYTAKACAFATAKVYLAAIGEAQARKQDHPTRRVL